MTELFYQAMALAVVVVEALGVAVILLGFAVAIGLYLRHARRQPSHQSYLEFRHRVGRSLILGLDFLIAADIIKTIAVDQTLVGVAALGGIVLIRALLSLTLFVEIEGHWPWQAARRQEEGE